MDTAKEDFLIAEFEGRTIWLAKGKSNMSKVKKAPKYRSSWDWQIPAWSKAIQEYDLPRKSVYKTRYAVATAMNDIELGFQILVELITEINQNKKHSLFECTCDRDLKYCKHPDLCESDKL